MQLDHNDPSKPSHRLTNGLEPLKNIESDGSNIKKNIVKPLMAMVRPPKNIQWWWSPQKPLKICNGLFKTIEIYNGFLKTLNLSMVLSNQYSVKTIELSCGHNYNLDLALL